MLLKNGSTGNYVMYLQYGLHIMCCPPGSFDSKFGSGTENAVKKYQGKKGLTQDGIVGDGTWNALVSDIKTIQQLLKNKGYYASTVDGLAGSGTYNAVISFQKASGLTADGMVGSATLNALNASSGGTSGQSHSITLPTDRNYLWAQKNPDIVKLDGKIDTSNYTHGGKEQATVFSAVKASIDNNLPIIIRLNSSDGKKTHFVTAIAYTGSCSSASSISVIDPAGGVIRTLEEAGTARNETVYGDYIATARRS